LRADALKYVWQELENSKNEDNQPQVEGLNDAVVSS
jgi:hypothetical protein